MNGIIKAIFKIILIVEFITGCLANGFIVWVNCMGWVKGRKISCVDQILTALSISRIALLLSVLTSFSVPVIYSDLLFNTEMIKIINCIWAVANHFCMWLATCLGLFYFLKIAKFSNPIIVYLRWRVKRVVLVTLLVSLIFMILHIVLINSHIDIFMDSYKDNRDNRSSLSIYIEFHRMSFIVMCIFISIPFIISQSTFLLLIFSLLKHLKKMQDNIQGCRDASTTAHVRALKVMVTSVLLCTIFFLGFLLQLSKIELLNNYLIYRFCQAAGMSFLSVHSCVLILGNTKLRQASISLLWWLWRRVKDVKSSDP